MTCTNDPYRHYDDGTCTAATSSSAALEDRWPSFPIVEQMPKITERQIFKTMRMRGIR